MQNAGGREQKGSAQSESKSESESESACAEAKDVGEGVGEGEDIRAPILQLRGVFRAPLEQPLIHCVHCKRSTVAAQTAAPAAASAASAAPPTDLLPASSTTGSPARESTHTWVIIKLNRNKCDCM